MKCAVSFNALFILAGNSMIQRIFLLLSFLTLAITSVQAFEIELPEIIIADVESHITLTSVDAPTTVETVIVNGKAIQPKIEEEKLVIPYTFSSAEENIECSIGTTTQSAPVTPIPLWLSILPPLLAILFALLFKEVITALFSGIFLGAAIIGIYTKGITGIFTAFLTVLDKYILNALLDWGHLAVVLFSLLIGAIVAVISKNGGMQGVVNRISKYATSPRSGQLATWFLGVAIFFDDYANTLVVGNTMRPITDNLKISREKLAYIVDSTAAPIAAIAFVTTWIGAELGYIADGVETITGLSQSPYSIFINSLQYSFYPVFTLLFMLMLIVKQVDFSAMWKAENRARTTGEVSSHQFTNSTKHTDLDEFEMREGLKPKSYNAIIPILVVVGGTIWGLVYTGLNATENIDPSWGFIRKVSEVIGNADSYQALLWASLSGLLAALLLSIGQKLLSLNEAIDTGISGIKTMLPAILILTLAWSLAEVTEDLHTADFLTSLLSNSVAPWAIPALTFILAAIVAFSTGSSWGTMAILYPLLLPASWSICSIAGYGEADTLMVFYNVVSCVLAGSVLGDHCSPISDTTILSSLASSCHHIDHVKTQMPYALTVGGVALLAGTLPAGFGIPVWILFPVGLLLLWGIVHFFGKKV
tara:strand:+ start:6980 stop:8920 length:1941 start_codon:yes stop_codon:yes gene_type:complete